MKKTILAIAALAVTMTGFSQDLMSKKERLTFLKLTIMHLALMRLVFSTR